MRWRLPEGRYRLTRARAPAAMIEGGAVDAEGFVETEVTVTDGRLSFAPSDAPAVDLKGAVVLPAFVDCHTHLDKGHIWPRRPNRTGTFDDALASVRADRDANWSERDVRARMDFALRCAWAHGTGAIRTHLDSFGAQTAISWGVFREMRAEWAGRIALQGVALTAIDQVGDAEFDAIADEVARSGGVLGTVTYMVPDMDERLDVFFRAAADRGLDADFHADESGDPGAVSLAAIARAKLRNGFEGRVLCGHCCSLSVQDEDEAARTMDLVAEAGLAVVSLPLCNMYLQGRGAGRTPRWRGVTLVHELKARGVPVAFASDNTRDPFYAYGDLDMLEVMREATRIAHLDHPVGDWPAAFGPTPAAVMGIDAGVLREGGPADFTIFPARGWTELLSRPHADRLTVRAGRPVVAAPPDYAELDALMEPT
ncbi:MAG: cytosine deaminase [Rhodobacteraceae bacterium]|nr:MAG: cytosine deaminase [Paracoccaceae bacterium]